MNFSRLSRIYIPIATLYCGIRKIIKTSDTHYKTKTYDPQSNSYNYTKIPMLLTDRVFVSLISGLTGMYIAPVCLINDIRLLEVKMRGLEKEYLNTNEPDTLCFMDVFVDLV